MRPCFRPRLEALEDRLAPATLGASSVVEGPAAGGDGVNLADTGSWKASSNATFLHVTSASSGSGNALVQFSFDANSGPTRTATLSIAGLTFTVTQAGSSYVAANPLTLVSSGLHEPEGVAVDSAGNVYIADTGNNAIKEYNASTQQLSTLVSGLSFPWGVAVDGAGNVFFSDTGDNAIDEYSASTKQVSTLVSSGLNFPFGVAVDGAGNVYIADPSTNAIDEYSASMKQLSTLVSGLFAPRGVAVDGAGNLFIADNGSQAIKENSASTKQVSTLVSGLNFPDGVAVDGAGNVFFSEEHNGAIKEYSASTKQVSTLVSSGLLGPNGVAVDGAGNVYIADIYHNAIKELPPRAFVSTAPLSEPVGAGSDQLLPVLPASQPLTGLFAPQSDQSWLSITSVANAVIHFSFSANTGAARTAHITVLGQQITVTQAAPSLGTTALLEGPGAGSDSDIVVSGPWTATANVPWLDTTASGTGDGLATFRFDANTGPTRTGTLTIAGLALTVTQAGSTYVAANPVTTLASSGLNFPFGVAVDGAGNVFIADTNNNAIKEYNASTQQLSTLVSSGLNGPTGVAVDGAGNVFIADYGNNAIKEYNASTQQLSTLVSTGLTSPSGVAVDGAGNVFIVEEIQNGVVKEYNATTEQVSTVVSTGLFDPFGVAVDAAGNVYIADQNNDAIKEYNASTKQLSTLVSGLNTPEGVAVDGAGNVFIADATNEAIKEHNAATGQVVTLVSSGLNVPQGVVVDRAGNVFIPDTGHSAVKELPRAFVSTAALSEPAAAGSDTLLPVLPTSQPLTGPFAPQSDQSWLTVGTAANGVIPFSFTANTTATARTAHITVLGQQISVTQAGLPTSAISFPARNGAYTATGWSGNISGTATDHSGSGIEQVQVSIQQASTGLFWNGASFSSAREVLLTAMGTTSWSLNFPIGNLAIDGTYVVHSVATDNLGDVESPGPTVTFLIHRVAPAATIAAVPSSDSALLIALAAAAARSSIAGAPFPAPTTVGQQGTTASFPGGRSSTEFRSQSGGGNQEEQAEASTLAPPSMQDAVDGAFQLPMPDTTDGIRLWVSDAKEAGLPFWATATAEGLPVEQGDPAFLEDGAPCLKVSSGVGRWAEESSASTAGVSLADVMFLDLGPGSAVDGREGTRMAALAAVALLPRPGLRGEAAARHEQRRRP
jgi:sugar lactone lactonase YvrE